MALPPSAWLRGVVFIATIVVRVHSKDIVVDDSDPTISYSPSNQWSIGTTCDVCTIHPDPSFSRGGNWHDTTYIPQTQSSPMSISYSFTGVAVQVFNILPPLVPAAPTTHTDLTFTLDGVSVGSYRNDPSSGADFQYNVQVFSQDDLDFRQHTLVIETTSGIESVVLFDYIVYTVPDPPPSSPPTIQSPTPDPPIITTLITTTAATDTNTSALLHPTTSVSSLTLTSSPSLSGVSPSPSSSTDTATGLKSPQADSIGTPTSSDHAFSSLTTSTGTTDGGSTIVTTEYVTSRTSTFAVVATLNAQANSAAGTIPTNVVLGVAIGGGFVVLILLAALVYVVCVRRTRRRLARLEEDHPEVSEQGDDAQLAQLKRELYPSRVPRLGRVEPEHNSIANPTPASHLQGENGISVAHEQSPPETEQHILLIGGSHTGSLVPSAPPSLDTIESPSVSRTSSQQFSAAGSTSVGHESSEEDKPLLLPAIELSIAPSVAPPAEAITQNRRRPLPVPVPGLFRHLVALQEEVAWLRANREADILLPDEPPRYDEVRSS
ncbi:hypothetical protein BN946_scf184867.g19 [Trametes cinnabarina]|uniref:Mid2 domain-containing protein n=1 Tax=Pycnoporus cinnabarinus TaxID=5643 RepID=A0A060SJS2_PYCCI|nr:hypothetical protein BN946_scf184867.g19 [Trametes cinnabarina]